MGCGAVLMKGGHLDDAESPDWLFTRDGEQRFTAPRVQTKNTHGTGCTLSAALAALRPRYEDWGEPWRKPRAGCRRRWRRRIRWKWGTASVRSTISTPGGKRQDNVSADYAEKIGSRLENLLSRYQA
jgi:sugar/nucleoside kinase (ribokinase family)